MALHLLHGPVPVSRQSPIVVRRGSVLSLKFKEPDPTQVRVLKVQGSGEYAPARSVGLAEHHPCGGGIRALLRRVFQDAYYSSMLGVTAISLA